RHLGMKRRVLDRQVGIFAFYAPEGAEPALRDRRTLIEAAEDGWFYASALPAGRAVVVFFTDSDLPAARVLRDRATFDQAVAGPRLLAGGLRGRREGSPVLRAASSGWLETPAGPDWLAVGDAAFTLDPLSGQGIVKALADGLWAAFAAADAL